MNKDEFIIKARNVHGDKYDYSKVVYTNNKTKVCIVCPEHGEFWQIPHNHLRGFGCPKCSGCDRNTTEEFIEKARKVHCNKYDYSKTVYKSLKDKVCIICPIHGEFWQIAGNHLRGEGCILCRNNDLSIRRRHTANDFIKKAKEVHGNKYDYSKVEYINNSTKVCITCPKHGEFWKTPANHIHGQGCPICTKENIKKKDEFKKEEKVVKSLKDIFIEKAKAKYGDKYDYSKVEYVNCSTKICIICPKHGEFFKIPNKFLYGQYCPECKKEEHKIAISSKSTEFIEKAQKIHNDKYDYSELNYNGTQKKVKIICHKKDKFGNEHGEFIQCAESHIQGCGCPKCAKEIRAEKSVKTTEKFIEEAKKIFPNYDYSKTVYKGQNTPIIITCHEKYKNGNEHGDFMVLPSKLLGRKTHCPHCTKATSFPEKEIYSYIAEKIGTENVKFHDRSVLNGEEIDIYVPSKKIGIEFDGLYWHSEFIERNTRNTHLRKTEECEKLGIRLIHIFSDEYFEKKEIVLSKICHILGLNSENIKIGARKCYIKEIDWPKSKEFLNKYHIQGSVNATIYLGAYFNDELVAVMTFVKEKDKCFCLNRFATNFKYTIQGIAGKLFKYFITKYNPSEIKTFADRRYSSIDNNLYPKIGFTFNSIIPPDYRYINKNKPSLGRIHKFNFRKQILHKKYNIPLTMTESEMAKEIGYGKIWDCGLIKYIWKK